MYMTILVEFESHSDMILDVARTWSPYKNVLGMGDNTVRTKLVET